MAYHQARGRDPLIDSSVQETLERRVLNFWVLR